MIAQVYQGRYPPALDIHFYDRSGARVRAVHAELTRLGLGAIPWIIGETFYDDPAGVTELLSAVSRERARVLYILQWPLTRKRTCQDVEVVPTGAPKTIVAPRSSQR
jgi:hypothetical protein